MRRSLIIAASVLCGFLAGATAAAANPAAANPAATVTLGRTLRAVPSSFLGLSIEYGELARYEREPAFEAFLSQLQAPGAGPLSLRIGGESADNTYLPSERRLSGWSYVLTPGWFSGFSALIRALQLRVIVDVNLAVRSAAHAAALAHAALVALPAGSIAAFEVGNEPDLFRFGIVGMRKVSHRNPGRFRWALSYSPKSYSADFDAYASALNGAAGAVTVAGPASADPSSTWWNALPVGRGRLGMVSVHRYPFAACGAPGSRAYPTVAGFLGAGATTGLARSVRQSVSLAHSRGLALRITELGTASCTGAAGVTDTFATALWAPDALCSLLAAGVDGVNVHSRFDTPNTPLDGAAVLTARPFLYGLIMFTRMLGPGARLQRANVRAGAGAGVSAWATRLADGTERVLLINKGAAAINTAVALPGRSRSPALLAALRARSPYATGGVTLAGMSLDSNGLWQGRPAIVAVRPNARGRYVTVLPGYSAVLLSVR